MRWTTLATFITVNDAIRLGQGLEPNGLAWMEDLCRGEMSRQPAGHRAINVPIVGGEDIYLWDGWREMIEQRAIDIIQPTC